MLYNFNLDDNKFNSTLWRYMDFSKFIDFLQTSTLFCPKVDLFEDKYEGIHNAIGENDFFDITNEGRIIRIDSVVEERQLENTYNFKLLCNKTLSTIRQSVGVSCWRISEYESHAMWKVFLKYNEGVAIRTSINTLLDSIEIEENKNVHIGRVKYIDYINEKVPFENLYNVLFYKNTYFEHENEFRLLVYEINDNLVNVFDGENMKTLEDNGLILDLNYKKVIKEIIVSPYAPNWFYNLLVKLLPDKFNLDIPINKSVIELR